MYKRVVNWAAVNSILYNFTVLSSACNRQVDLDSEIVQAPEPFSYRQTRARESLHSAGPSSADIQRVVSSTRSQRGQHQFQRCHSFIEAAVLLRLIARNRMLPRADLKLYISKVVLQ